MTSVVESIEIAARPETVFSVATDFGRFPQWQGGVVSANRADGGPLAVGSQAVVTRRIGPRTVPQTERIAELVPPHSWVVRGTGGAPVEAIVTGQIEPLDGGRRSRLTISIDFEAHGIGRLLLPLVVRRQTRRTLPGNERRLKALVERAG
jgi:uncharacterized protein YndB with AHSA1/START domain